MNYNDVSVWIPGLFLVQVKNIHDHQKPGQVRGGYNPGHNLGLLGSQLDYFS